MNTKRFRKWLKESFSSDFEAISLHKEMAQVPKPGGWHGPFDAKFDDRQGRFSKGDKIYWNRKSGAEAQNMPAYTDDDPNFAPRSPKTSARLARSPVESPKVSNQGPLVTSTTKGDFVLNFSKKHIGKTLSWVAKNDPGFIEWMLKNNVRGNFLDDQGKPANVTPQMLMKAIGAGGDLEDLDDSSGSEMIQQHQDSKRPLPESVRLPPEKMTKYNQEIQNRFLQSSENIMVNALAGTGKTTTLKHLSSFIKPGEKWLYLVFNKKNQVESQDAFPKGVTVMTTHAFLGNVLKGVDKSVGGKTRLPPRSWRKQTKLDKISDSRNITPLEWPESSHSQHIEQKVFEFNPATGKNEYTGRTERVLKSPWNWNARKRATEIASRAKAAALNPNDPDIEKQIAALVERYSLDTSVANPNSKKQPERDFTPDIIKKSVEFLKLSEPGIASQHLPYVSDLRDQDDTLWYAAIYADQINWNLGYDVILMDEVQDFNMCQIIMAKKLREAGARVIAVGDPNQGMYLFRGADGDAFNKLGEALGTTDAAPLPINFRSGGNILDWVNQNTHVNDMQYPEKSKGKGEVWASGGTHDPIGYEDFMFTLMDEWDKNKRLNMDTAMIARTNAPLAHAALTFLKNNINFEIVGVDLSKEIVDLINKVTYNKPENVSLDKFISDLAEYNENCQKMWANQISKRHELKEVRAYTGVIQAVYEHLSDQGFRDGQNSEPIENAAALSQWLQDRLGGVNENDADDMKAMEDRKKSTPGGFVTLTTAHKSKGLEYDRAFLMKPSQFDPESEMVRTEEEAQQEKNAWYVAATRAKNVLMVSSDDEPDASGGDDDSALDSDEIKPTLGRAAMAKKMRMF